MGKAAKKRQREARKALKRQIKAAKKAFWESIAGTAQNKKKARNSLIKKPPQWSKCHEGRCGNIGCKRCSSIFK